MSRTKTLKRTNWYLFISLFIYNILDAWHTKLLLATGVIQEANPVMDYFIHNYGINSCFYVKIVLSIFLGIVLYKLHRGVK